MKVVVSLLIVFAMMCFPISAFAQGNCFDVEACVESFYLDQVYRQNGLWRMGDVQVRYLASLFDYHSNIMQYALYSIYEDDIYSGYAIVDTTTDIVVEFGFGNIPYSESRLSQEKNNEVVLYYNLYSYGYKEAKEVVFEYSDWNEDSPRVLSGSYSIYLQGSANCVTCALSHIIVYWSSLFPTFASVNSQSDFNSLMATVGALYSNEGYNSQTPGAFSHYCQNRSNNSAYGTSGLYYQGSASNTWSPSFANVTSALAIGRPILLGFDSSGAYGGAHMTMCVDAYTLNGTNYVVVVDGHSSSTVVHAWSSHNDYMCIFNLKSVYLY